MIVFYNLGIFLYRFSIFIASFFNSKAKEWIKGRKNIYTNLSSQITDNKNIVWFHCASLGEFEQGRPLLEKIKSLHPDHQILLTFFSPSGFEIRKDYPHADYIFYLPIDSKKNARKFLNIVKPKMVFFVKYEFWFHYLNELQKSNTPTFLISSVFRKDQIFFKWYGKFFKRMLSFFNHIFVQNEDSITMLLQNEIKNHSLTGDTRVDRVLKLQKKVEPIDKINSFKGTSELLIGGSTWQQDEDILIEWIEKQNDFRWKLILAPHDVSESHLKQIEDKLKINSVRFSKANAFNLSAARVLIIDNIGMLSSIYQYGKLAFVGGGFGKGIHNTLEPIAFGLPVFFGKKYEKFEEAKYLVHSGGGFSIDNFSEFNSILKKLENENFYNNTSTIAKNYILENQGATEKIYISIKKHF